MATAVLLFVVNLIGYGFGPLFIGAISDIFFVSGIAEFGVATEELARNQCHPAVIGQLSDNLQNVCGDVYAHGYHGLDNFLQRVCGRRAGALQW